MHCLISPCILSFLVIGITVLSVEAFQVLNSYVNLISCSLVIAWALFILLNSILNNLGLWLCVFCVIIHGSSKLPSFTVDLWALISTQYAGYWFTGPVLHDYSLHIVRLCHHWSLFTDDIWALSVFGFVYCSGVRGLHLSPFPCLHCTHCNPLWLWQNLFRIKWCLDVHLELGWKCRG